MILGSCSDEYNIEILLEDDGECMSRMCKDLAISLATLQSRTPLDLAVETDGFDQEVLALECCWR